MCDSVQTWAMISFKIVHQWQPREVPRRGRNRDVSGAVLRFLNSMNMEN